jgi:hypothetical protein
MATAGGCHGYEHAASPAQGVPSLEQAIARVTRLAEENERAKEILAAAVTLRDSIGRDRQRAIKAMAKIWGVSRYAKNELGWKDRPLADIARDVEAGVCQAAFECQSSAASEHADQSAPGRNESTSDEGPTNKKPKTSGAAVKQSAGHRAGSSTLCELPVTPNDVKTLRRLGADNFEATLVSGATWRGDAELLKTLPHGEARLATLRVKEMVQCLFGKLD